MAARHPLRILLAEDNVVNQKLALRILQQMGYRADLASNGIEAVESVERQTYDVVLMDVQMPEMDGLEASRRITAQWPAGERPRIVAMTANAMQGDREMCLAAGMDDYITKPIRVDQLVEALDAACRHARSEPDDDERRRSIAAALRRAAGHRRRRVRRASWWTRSSRGARHAGRAAQRSRRRDDADRFRRAAHSLKSNSNTFGALRLAALARELELNGLDAGPGTRRRARSTRSRPSTRAPPPH